MYESFLHIAKVHRGVGRMGELNRAEMLLEECEPRGQRHLGWNLSHAGSPHADLLTLSRA